MSAKIRLGLLGASGRMGTLVRSLVSGEGTAASTYDLIAAPARGESQDGLLTCDAVIDFSQPDAMLELTRKVLASRGTLPRLPVFVVGSTGWNMDTRKELQAFAQATPVLMASNFSLGAQIMIAMLKQWSPALDRAKFTASISETHHVHKKDRPSGTALALASAIAPAGPGNIPTQSIREGEVIGDHTVTFENAGERLTLQHHAKDRSIFAHGALEVAAWLHRERDKLARESRLLGMSDFFK